MEALILAGGMGTRLRSVVHDVPKPMANIAGRPFLAYLMDYWISQGISRFTLSVSYKKDKIIDFFGTKYKNTSIAYLEELEPLGTGGALILASQTLSDTFVVLNGDTLFKVNLSKFIRNHLDSKSNWTVALFNADESDRYGKINIDSIGRINNFQSGKSQVGQLSNGGVYIINPKILRESSFKIGTKYSLEEEIIPTLINDGNHFFGFKEEAEFLDIRVPADYFKAQEILINQQDNKTSKVNKCHTKS